jgi:hypothetical protein
MAERRKQRMVEDGAMILDEGRWPNDPLHVKTQPWVEGEREFGLVHSTNKTTVINKDKRKMNEAFDSISALVEKWSVD